MATLPIVPFQTSAQKYQIVKDAILARRPLAAIYKDRVRLVCPHVLGEDKNGCYQALFYQFAGESSSRPIMPDGSTDNWRCLALEKLSSVQVAEGDRGWHTAPNHSRPQTCVKRVHVEVQF
jgi:hypothetical protein